jgi:hypothetical protein
MGQSHEEPQLRQALRQSFLEQLSPCCDSGPQAGSPGAVLYWWSQRIRLRWLWSLQPMENEKHSKQHVTKDHAASTWLNWILGTSEPLLGGAPAHDHAVWGYFKSSGNATQGQMWMKKAPLDDNFQLLKQN